MQEPGTKIRITWADTDAAGIVHFSNYFRYFERAEEEYLNRRGLDYSSIVNTYRVRIPRVESHCRYISPCKYNDTISVKMKLDEVKTRSFKESFVVDNLTTRKRAAEGYLVCVTASLDLTKAVPIPKKLVSKLMIK
jgi:acyl-CoA thioester hydrolase